MKFPSNILLNLTLDRSTPCAAALVGRRQAPLSSALDGREAIDSEGLKGFFDTDGFEYLTQ